MGCSRALRRLSLPLYLTVLALLAAPPLALALGITTTRTANLDSDPPLEQVVPQEVCTSLAGPARASSCGADQFAQHRVVVADTCNGVPYAVVASSVQDAVDRLKIEDIDGRRDRPEIFFDMRSGASGRVGEVRVVRWEDRPGACPAVHDLFRYPAHRTSGAIPRRRGARFRVAFSPTLHDFSNRYRGKELLMRETYADRNDAFCCPSFARTTYFRYSPAKDAYVRYRTRVKRIKRGP
jgi:hypothetical protein